MKRRLLGEYIGTFAIVFAPVACGAVAKISGNDLGLLAAALVSALPVSAMIFALRPICGAHFNPAVTIAFATTRHFSWRDVFPYALSQFGGALTAGGLSALLFVSGGGIHQSVAPEAIFRNIGTEAVLSFFLMFVILAVATNRRVSGSVPAIAIGLTVVFDILIGGPITGGSMNPARTFGAVAFGGHISLAYMATYIIGPCLGALAGAFAYEAVRTPEPSDV